MPRAGDEQNCERCGARILWSVSGGRADARRRDVDRQDRSGRWTDLEAMTVHRCPSTATALAGLSDRVDEMARALVEAVERIREQLPRPVSPTGSGSSTGFGRLAQPERGRPASESPLPVVRPIPAGNQDSSRLPGGAVEI